MATLEEVLAFRKEMFERSMSIIEKKGHDYAGDKQSSNDTLFNLRVSEILGVSNSIEEGIMVRMTDKLMRLISLCKPGKEAKVSDESVLDTIMDLHNYADYLGLEWQQRRACNKMPEEESLAQAMARVGVDAYRYKK